MKQLLLAGFGGFLGSAARHLAATSLTPLLAQWRFPLPTFLINVTGCLAIGVLGGLVTRGQFASEDVRVFLFTGILGGFTTFSTFAGEGLTLLRRGDAAVAAGYMAASVVAGLIAAWCGWRLASAG